MRQFPLFWKRYLEHGTEFHNTHIHKEHKHEAMLAGLYKVPQILFYSHIHIFSSHRNAKETRIHIECE